jgi:hypothetical protein
VKDLRLLSGLPGADYDCTEHKQENAQIPHKSVDTASQLKVQSNVQSDRGRAGAPRTTAELCTAI